MGDEKILSKEEVDALVTASNENGAQENNTWGNTTIDRSKVLTNITGLMIAECEKTLSSFLRKKLSLTEKVSESKKISEYLEAKTEKHVYTLFELMPNECYGMIVLDLPLLHQAISLLYGGQYLKGEPIIENPGKIGLVVAEKIGQIIMDGFTQGLKEYGQTDSHVVKTMTQPNLSSKLSVDDQVHIVEMNLVIGETESTVTLMAVEEFFNQFFTVNVGKLATALPEKAIDAHDWRSVIEAQVADTCVTVQAILPNVSIKLSELMTLKKGALIPIGDPTIVYLSLNDLKLFRATAGQANSKRVAKILGEV